MHTVEDDLEAITLSLRCPRFDPVSDSEITGSSSQVFYKSKREYPRRPEIICRVTYLRKYPDFPHPHTRTGIPNSWRQLQDLHSRSKGGHHVMHGNCYVRLKLRL